MKLEGFYYFIRRGIKELPSRICLMNPRDICFVHHAIAEEPHRDLIFDDAIPSL